MTDDERQPPSEYEREPVPPRAQLGFKSFIGMYAGDHTAGTELMIGPLFVAHGVSAFDVIVGLLLGNLLAVLSWTCLTAPIATRRRLTLYYQLEKICGRKLVTLYNLANGIMFCFLAGAMVTVSATAVGVFALLHLEAAPAITATRLGTLAHAFPADFFMTTALADKDNLLEAIPLCDAYLVKPIHMSDLMFYLQRFGLVR